MWEIKPSFVTFIIPTKGRPSLEKAIQSLLNLDDWNWRAIILFDGVESVEIKCVDYLNDNHFIVRKEEKIGHAGLLRNLAFPLIDTIWTAFLDDDDYLKETYITKLREYSSKNPELDIIIFTYKDVSNGNTQPPKGTTEFQCCNVGISFAIKTEFIRKYNILFPPGGVEDFAFLDVCRDLGAKYLVTNDIQYFVGRRSAWE
jgi:glycosyltransferase involved in cell wall biosynthesis